MLFFILICLVWADKPAIKELFDTAVAHAVSTHCPFADMKGMHKMCEISHNSNPMTPLPVTLGTGWDPVKAEIKIPESQARDLELGQPASIDTRNGIVAGRVVRIDPASQNGSVTVDVKLDGPLPKGARPELSVEGTIDLEHLPDVLFVGRPVNAQSGSTSGVFKLVNGGKEAIRVPVKFGSESVRFIVVKDGGGLQEGDQIIASDMATWDAHDRVRLN